MPLAKTHVAVPGEQDRNAGLVDLVERTRLQLRRSEELAALGRLTAGVAHELNNPLAALLGTLELMRKVASEPDGSSAGERLADLRAMLVDCNGIADRIKDLVMSLRRMSRNGVNDEIVFDPGRAIRDAVKVFAVAHRRDCQVELSLAALPALSGSPTRLGQVILNLLQNGLEASPSHAECTGGARLAVAANGIGNEIHITVKDHGRGIPTEIASSVFDAFFTSKEPDWGTGLGLALCRDIVTHMGGSIDFESAPGSTIFRIVLPVVQHDRVSE